MRVASCLAAALVAAAAVGETTTSENGYAVTRSQTLVPVPHGKIGRKTIDVETRTGNTEDTGGKSTNLTMTLGGFLDRCPVPEGRPARFVVSGDFEYSLVVDAADTAVVPTGREHHEKRVTARIRVFVNDDLSVTEGEIDGQFSSDIDGARTGPVPIRRHFRVGASGTPDMGALTDVVAATGDLAAAALIWNASTTILAAQGEWRQPNACAELEFEPASGTRAVSQGETVEIRVKYRTRDGQLPIPKGGWDATVEQGGRLPQATGAVQPDGSFTVRYLARSSGAPKAGDGARIEALSAAGLARDTWKIRVDDQYEGTFRQIELQPQRGTAGYGAVEILQKTTIEGRLVWSPKQDQLQTADIPRLPSIAGVRSTFYVPTDGEISVHFEHDATGPGGRCRFSGSKVFPIAQLPSSALRYMSLEVADDGRYKLALGMAPGPLPIPVVNHGCRWLILPLDVDSVWKDAGIQIGIRQGTLANDNIEGEVSPPMVIGPSTTTGSWSFKPRQ